MYKAYIVSMSSSTIIYKGLTTSDKLKEFYLDLKDPDYITQFAVYHRRFSTNTLPRWSLAQPFRYISHNGEINTYVGNINWSKARENVYSSEFVDPMMDDIRPVVGTLGSDSAALDNMVELLVISGYSPQKALMLLLPEAYKEHPSFENREDLINFYDFYAGMQEPWDGPANVTFCDGRILGATLDRNGLRPARYDITSDGYVYFGSEIGSNVIPQDKVIKKGRLGPGNMFVIDLEAGEIIPNADIKKRVAAGNPYGQWLAENRLLLKSEDSDFKEEPMDPKTALKW